MAENLGPGSIEPPESLDAFAVDEADLGQIETHLVVAPEKLCAFALQQHRPLGYDTPLEPQYRSGVRSFVLGYSQYHVDLLLFTNTTTHIARAVPGTTHSFLEGLKRLNGSDLDGQKVCGFG